MNRYGRSVQGIRVLISQKDYLQRQQDRLQSVFGWKVDFLDFTQADFDNYDAIIPVTLADAAIVSQAMAVGKRVSAIVPGAAVIRLCHDKQAFNTRLTDLGFGHVLPRVIDKAAQPPFILKRRQASFGHDSYLVLTCTDLDRLRRRVESADYFCQELVIDRLEYAAHFLVSDGRVRYHTTVEYDMQVPVFVRNAATRGITTRRNFVSPFLPVFCDILQAIGFTDGTCCFDYKLHRGQLRLLELNPRFGGSLGGDLPTYMQAYIEALCDHPGHCRMAQLA